MESQQKLNRTHKTIEEKIKIVRFAEQNSIHKAAEKYNVDRKNIRSWKSQLPDLITQTNKSTKMIMHSGKKPETEEIDDEIIEWILMNRKLGIAVTSWEVIVKACSMKEELKKSSLSALQKWCYRLLVRYHLTFRAGTHVGQELPENYREKMFDFIKLNETYRKNNDLELAQVANMDETPLFLNMVRTKTIAKIGSKTVNIKTHGQEKVRVTAVLWIIADGTKLPPVLVFKGKPDGRIAKELGKHPLVESKQVFSYWHRKAWNNEDIMMKWINAVWRKYAHFKLKKKNMLILDDASMHKTPGIRKSIELSETKVMMIPDGLTRYLQPLDVSINKPFKDGIRRKYNEYWLEKGDVKVSRKEIIDWVGEVWYDDKLSTDMVVKSFKKAGVTLNTDGSEDNLFIGYNKDEEIKEMVAEVEEIVAEVDQIVIIEDEEQVDIEIVKEKIDEPYDDSCSIAFAESDDEEEEKGG